MWDLRILIDKNWHLAMGTSKTTALGRVYLEKIARLTPGKRPKQKLNFR